MAPMTLKIINNANVLAADTIAFTEGGAEAMRIDSSGAVIVNNAGGDAQIYIGGASGTSRMYLARSGTETLLWNVSNGVMRFGTNDTERMRITSGGDVVIGTTASGAKFHLQYDGNATVGQLCKDTYASAGTNKAIQFVRNTTEVGTITMTTSATAYNTSSDYRLKENVVYNLNGIERVKLLKPARFNFIIEPNKTVDGFLAHEVQDIVPESIYGTKDQVEAIGNIKDVEGNIIQEDVKEPNELSENQTWTQTGIRPVYQAIDQSKLVPLLTGALQEAIAKIESLEARLTALES